MAVKLTDIKRVKSIEHTPEPTWGPDAGRNSNSGKFSGTFVGYFDTLKVEVGKTTREEMKTLRSLIDRPVIEVTFPDSVTGGDSTREFYGTAIPAKLNHLTGRYDACSFSLKAIERRSDM